MENTEAHPKQKEKRKKPWFLLFFLLLVVVISASSIWLVTTPSGLRFLLSSVSRISGDGILFEEVKGTLRALSIKKINYTSEGLHATINEIELQWQPRLLFSRQLAIDILATKAIEIQSSPSPETSKKEPLVLPDNLQLPLSIILQKLEIGSLQMLTIGKETPDFTITDITASIESDAEHHSLRQVSLESEFGKLSGSLQIAPDKPFDLEAQATLLGLLPLAETASTEADIFIHLTGSLEEIKGTLTGMSKDTQGKGNFVLHPFAAMPLAALHLSIDKLNPSTFLADLPKANLSIYTDLLEDSVGKLQGNIVIKNDLPLPLDQHGLPIVEIRTQPLISLDEIQFDDILLKLADSASISGHFNWQIAQAMGAADLKVNQLNPAALDTRLQAAKINGHLKLTGDTTTQQGLIFLHDKSKALSLETDLVRTETAVSVEKITLRHHNSMLTGQGQLDLKESQSFQFESKVSQFDLASFMQAPRSNLNATLKLSGKLEPQISGVVDFNVTKSQFNKQPVVGKGRVAIEDAKRIKSELNLQIGTNQFRAEGAFGNKGDRLLLNLAAPALAQLGLKVAGDLNTKITLADTLDSPKLLIESSAKDLKISDNHLSGITVTGNLQKSAVDLAVKMAHYRLEAEDYLKNFAMTLTGNQTRHKLSIDTDLPRDSHFTFHTTGKLLLPTGNNHDFQWSGELEKLAATGFLPFHLLNQPAVTISQKRIALEPTRVSVADGEISILEAHWTPQQWSSRGTLKGIHLKSENAQLQDIEALQMGGEWDITASKQLNGHIRIARDKGDWAWLLEDSPLQLGLHQLQFNARAQAGNLMADLVIRGEKVGETVASVTLPLASNEGAWQIAKDQPLSGKMNVNIADLSWIGSTVNSSLKSNGQLFLQTNVVGTFNQPRLEGIIEGKELAIALLDEGIDLQQGSLKAHFDQTALRINTLTFVSPHQNPPKDAILYKIKLPKEEGRLTVTGAIDYQDQRSHLNIEIDHLPVAQQSDRWIIASGNSQVSLDKQQLTINGKLTTDAGFIKQPKAGHPNLPDDVVIIKAQSPPPDGSQKLLVNVDAALDLGEHFYLQASGLKGRLAGQLRLSSKPGKPLHAIGTITAVDTIFDAYGQYLSVQRGIVSFNGPLDDPALNVLAIRPNLPVEAGVQVTGTVRKPIVKLVSTPNVPDAEKLSWIVLGRPPDAGGTDTSLLLSAAGSILGGQGGGIAKTLGMDEFTIKQQQITDSRSDGALSGQIGVIGKRLSSRLYLSYERGLTSATAGITKLTYNLTRNITIVSRAGEDNAIDLYYNFQLD
ncbi:translocation/assembly module TamB domain-containing protein [Nitrosomonas sp. Nm34]|uniref:translocation/assembly module TamB domain-containing protein n=1 Tax=Nitrosomonas sp. Nm34 TaxID=1881055 RepID=UPI0008DFA734|nr:translocation/assembly module TamB domain-containing protein [Nitrosomonas sp. Nm34]SFI89226.1 translocation and assembly module TamB [Nitrosomonas sp. Nm34]